MQGEQKVRRCLHVNVPQRYALLADFSLVAGIKEAQVGLQSTLIDNFDGPVRMRRRQGTDA